MPATDRRLLLYCENLCYGLQYASFCLNFPLVSFCTYYSFIQQYPVAYQAHIYSHFYINSRQCRHNVFRLSVHLSVVHLFIDISGCQRIWQTTVSSSLTSACAQLTRPTQQCVLFDGHTTPLAIGVSQRLDHTCGTITF